MSDALYIAVSVAFFAVTWGLVVLFERLRRGA